MTLDDFWQGPADEGRVRLSLQILQNGSKIQSRLAPCAWVRRIRKILSATPSAAGPHSRKEGCVVVAMLCSLICLVGFVVVGCFECFGFLVKCAEASWLLEIGFYCIFTYSCYLGHGNCYLGFPKSIIWQAWCFNLTILGPFCQLGDALEDHGSIRNDTLGS